MENILKDLSNLIKLPNDSKTQLKELSLLKDLLETIKKLEKKKLNEYQQIIENFLYELVSKSRATNDIIVRYIYYIYQELYDIGLSTHLNDFIAKYSLLLTAKISQNIKSTIMWLMGKICTMCEYKSPSIVELIKTLIKFIKSSSESVMKHRGFNLIGKLLNLKLPSFMILIPDILKLFFKLERSINEKKGLLKCLDSLIYFLNPQLIEKNYPQIIEFLFRCFDSEDIKINKISMQIYINLHIEKVFDPNIQKNQIMRRKDFEPLKNFLEVLLYTGMVISHSKNSEMSINIKKSLIEITCQFFLINKDYINTSETFITKIYDIILNDFPIVIDETIGLNSISLNGRLRRTISTEEINTDDLDLYKSIEKLYRTYIKIIYNFTFRKHLLLHIFKRLNNSKSDMDEIENYFQNLNSSFNNINNNMRNSYGSKDGKKQKKYTFPQINALLFSLIEYSESNADMFEYVYKSFPDFSNDISIYCTSSIRSFRLLISKCLANLAYFLPSWRISILTLILNMSSVAHAEVQTLKNTLLYFIDENNPEYKYSLLLKKSISLLKDICYCLALILSMFSHKSHGVPIDISLNAMNRAKRIIFGNIIDESSSNPTYMSISEIANNYSKIDAQACKECGWIIIQGLCTMDQTWLVSNSSSFLFFWNFVFSKESCEVNEVDIVNKLEYRDTLATEFYIKKAALASMRKFILSCHEDFLNSSYFVNEIRKIIPNLINFFIPKKKQYLTDFYNEYFKESYQEAKMFLYDIFYSIPLKIYNNKFNLLLFSLSDVITNNQYTNKNYEHIYSCLNQTDNFMCNKNLDIDKYNDEQEFLIDNFVVEKYNFKLTNLLSKNAQFVFSAIKLFVEIVVSDLLIKENRAACFKHLLSVIIEKNLNKLNLGNYNAIVNIAITCYLIVEKCCNRNLTFIDDENLFMNAKMIFDFCYQIEAPDNLLRIIASEGHGYLIKSSKNTKDNLNEYLLSTETKLETQNNLTEINYINSFYLFANIFRHVNFSDISNYLDQFMNFIISNFNKLDNILSDPLLPQSIFVIINVLICNDQIDYARKLIEIYKMNFLFINMKNNYFFKDLFETVSLAEIRLMIILASLNDNIKSNEFELLKLLLSKYLKDEKYKSDKIQKNFLYFAKILTKCHPKIKDLVVNENFVNFLFEKKNSFYEQKLSYEILISLLISDMKFDPKKINIKLNMENLVNDINNMYNFNRNFYFSHEIFCRNFRDFKTKNLIYDNNILEENLQSIASLINYDNFNHNNYDVLYKDFHLIKLAKFIIRIYIEKNYLNVLLLLNMIKELVQNQLLLYSSELNKKKEENNEESLKSEEMNSSTNKNVTLITIRELNYYMHLNLKRFLIKIIINSLINSLDYVLSRNNNKTSMIEVLNLFMGNSMVLVSSEESWDLKILGIELLIQTIKKFATVIDNRTDDNSLLIQQYEAQISSCIKIIFNNTLSIKSVYKGLKLIYMFITIPISTDENYIKKVSHMVDLKDLKKNEFSLTAGGGFSTAFSEKADHVLICKKILFFCKLYISLKNNKNLIMNCYNVENSLVSQINIYAQFITEPYKKSIQLFFDENFEIFFDNLLKMLNDCYILLVSDQKTALESKYNFIYSGNRISYSEPLIIKYGQIFLKVFGMLINDPLFKTKDIKLDTEKIKMIVNLLFFYMNNYFIKKEYNLQFDDGKIPNEYKISFALNSVLMVELMDTFVKIINNDMPNFNIDGELFINIIKIIIQIMRFNINELNIQSFVLLESISKKYLNNNTMKNDLKVEQKIYIIETLSKFLYFYINKTSFVKGKENMLFVDINSALIDFIITVYNDELIEKCKEINEYFNINLTYMIQNFEIFSNNNSKICASKIFNSMILIKNKNLLNIIINEIINALLNLCKNNTFFDKFFIIYFMIIQHISKTQDNELINITKENLIVNINKNISNKNFIFCINKATLLAISQNFDEHLKELVELIIINYIQNGFLIYYFTDDIQNIILNYTLNLNDENKRKEFIKIILLNLLEHKNNFDLNKLSIFIFKLFSKDNEFLKNEEIQSFFDDSMKNAINNLIEMQIKYQKEQEEKKLKMLQEQKEKEEAELKRREEMKKKLEEKQNQNSNQSDSNVSQTKASGGGPKIKALKWGKK